MERLVAIGKAFYKLEESIVAFFIIVITTLVFLSAITRSIGFPLNWAQDLALLLMAWVVFLGADVALRTVGFIRVDMLVVLFPSWIQKILYYVFNALAIALLLAIVYFGTALAFTHTSRIYQTLGLSYSWATASAPLGSFLMIVTLLRKMYENRHNPLVPSEGREAI